MQFERTKDRERALRPPSAQAPTLALVASLLTQLASAPALAAPGDAEGARGLLFARRRDCVKAVPLLETAERLRHRPSTAVPLADCYVATGDLLRAGDVYRRVAGEKAARFWVRADYNAAKAAKQKAVDVDARIPTLRFEVPVTYEGLEVLLDGAPVSDLDAERRLAPDVAVSVVARALGRKDFIDKIVLNEGERRVVVLRLPLAGAARKGFRRHRRAPAGELARGPLLRRRPPQIRDEPGRRRRHHAGDPGRRLHLHHARPATRR